MQILPLLNDLVNANPGKKYFCIISSPGQRLMTKQSPSRVFWKYTVVCENKEYTYFANSESHMLDIERPRGMGKAVEIWMKIWEDEQGESRTYYAEGVELTKDMKTNLYQEEKPDWDAIARRDKRHEYALEVFKEMLKVEGRYAGIQESTVKIINEWVEFSMTGEVPKKDSKDLSSEPF